MRIAIVGITGLVGEEMLKCITDLCIKYTELYFFASRKSAGKIIIYNNKNYIINEVKKNSFKNIDIALFAISSELSKKYSVYARLHNCLVIDNSSAFRLDKDVPLIVPEVNSAHIKNNNGIIANPNCSTILMCVVLNNLHKNFGIERIVVSTYQAASGAGRKGIIELERQACEFMKGIQIFEDNIFGRQYLWNIFSHNSEITDNGYNEEEMKMINETKKILNDDNIKISATCIRVPVFRSHCESINITFKNEVSEELLRETLINSEGIELLDDRINNMFPEPIITSNKHNVYVGRIRHDLSQKKNYGYEMFISGDQILKGAALNTIQILNKMIN
jgi:aspartate-semialdehyde dehydrogenase